MPEKPVSSQAWKYRTFVLIRQRHVDLEARTRVAAVLARLAVDDPVGLLDGDESSRISARVLALRWGGVELITSEFLAPGTHLGLSFPKAGAGWGEVDRCKPNAGEFAVSITLLDGQFSATSEPTRREPRYSVNISGLLRVPGIKGAFYAITILDVSRSGLRIQSPRAVDAGRKVEVISRDARVAGEVRYSRQVAADEFHLGIHAGPNGNVLGQTGPLDLTLLRHARRSA